jgi:pSer/pThr/pTyr-binding forkhead associated (FHA) protein
VTVGRATENQIVLTHGTVSRRHAWLREEAGGWLVADAGSANGTFVNGQRLTAPRPLNHGDVVSFGKQEFLFEVFGA